MLSIEYDRYTLRRWRIGDEDADVALHNFHFSLDVGA